MALKRYGSLEFDQESNKWILKNLEPYVVIRLKRIFESIPKGAHRKYEIGNKPDTCADLEWFLKRYPMDVSSDDQERLQNQSSKYYGILDQNEKILAPNYIPKEIKLEHGEARDYQKLFVDLFLINKKMINGDQVGLGKTVEALCALVATNAAPMAVVLKAHLPTQWTEKIKEFMPSLKVHLVKKRTPYNLPEADIYIYTYSKLAGWLDVIEGLGFRFCCFDECQELRIPHSLKYQAAKILSDSCEYSLGLSATPIYNYGDESHSVFDLVKDGCLGTRQEFLTEWADGVRIVKDPKALGSYLRDQGLFIRRTRKDVGKELPEINSLVYDIDVDDEEMENVYKMAESLAIKSLSGNFQTVGQSRRELDIMMRYQTGVAKARPVANIAKMFLDAGEKVLLAGWHRDVYEIWKKELKEYNPVMYTGSETPKKKNESFLKFTSNESQIMFISLRSGDGLDGLQKHCSVLINGELDWTKKIHEQLEGRLNRDDLLGQVTSVYPLSNSGSDPVMIELLGLKSSQADGITDPFSGVKMKTSDGSRLEALAKSILRKRGKMI